MVVSVSPESTSVWAVVVGDMARGRREKSSTSRSRSEDTGRVGIVTNPALRKPRNARNENW